MYQSKTEPYQMLLGAGQDAVGVLSELNKEKQSNKILSAQLENQLLMAMITRKDKDADYGIKLKELELKEKEINNQGKYWEALAGKQPGGAGTKAEIEKQKWTVLQGLVFGDQTKNNPGIIMRDQKGEIDPAATWGKAAYVYPLLPKLGLLPDEFDAYLSTTAGPKPGPVAPTGLTPEVTPEPVSLLEYFLGPKEATNRFIPFVPRGVKPAGAVAAQSSKVKAQSGTLQGMTITPKRP